MNKFDRVTSLLLLLQTRPIVTAQFLSDYFNVSERTIYRDIKTLENAGVPIVSEAGLGYFLEKGYRLPPVSFTLDEAASLLIGEKLLISTLDTDSLHNFKQALNKIRAVVNSSDKDDLSSFDNNIEVFPTSSHFPIDSLNLNTHKKKEIPQSTDRWLIESRNALIHKEVVRIDYIAFNNNGNTSRDIEPIGLFYYNWHWHLIAWCLLREDYRDFRLDRIESFVPQGKLFIKHDRLTLNEYLDKQTNREDLEEVELFFSLEAAKFVEEQRYLFGFIDEEKQVNGVKMRFLPSLPEYMARWLLQYTNEVEVIKGSTLKEAMQKFTSELYNHWNKK